MIKKSVNKTNSSTSASRPFFSGSMRAGVESHEPFFQSPITPVALPAIVQKKCESCEEEHQEKTQADAETSLHEKEHALPLPPPPAEGASNNTRVHAKLSIGAADDPHEKEADRFADRLMQMPAMPAPTMSDFNPSSAEKQSVAPVSAVAGRLSARAEQSGLVVAPAVTNELASSKGDGTPLPDNLQHKMEYASGQDLSAVRIHTSSRAHKMSQDLNARAFAHGQDIYFKQGQFQPHTTSGQHLLAHEVGHVVGGHTDIRRNLDDYDVVPLGKHKTLWALARSYGLDVADTIALNEKAYLEEYGRAFNSKRLFPNSRLFLPKGTIPLHFNKEATEVELKKKTLRSQHIDDALYPGTMQGYEIRYFVTEYDDEDTELISYDLVISQKLAILLDNGSQFTVKIWASIALPSFNVERETMTWKQLGEIWNKVSREVGAIQISIDSDTAATDPVNLNDVAYATNVYGTKHKGSSLQAQHASVAEAFGNLDSSIQEKYRAAIQVTRKEVEKSSYTLIDYKNRLDGEVFYTLRQASAALIRMEKFPGDGVVSQTRDGRYRTVALTQGDMYFIADYLRNGSNQYVSTPRLWWVKDDEKIVHFMHDGFFEDKRTLLEGFFFPSYKEALEHAEKSAISYSAAFITHTNGFYGWLPAVTQDLEGALDHAIKNLPQGASFEDFIKVSLPTLKLSIPAVMPAKAFGLRSGRQFHLIDQEYFEGRDIWLTNETAFSADVDSNPIIAFINNHPSEGRKLYRYLQVEFDRKHEIGQGLSARIDLKEPTQLTENVQAFAVSQIWHWSRKKALEIVGTSVSRLTSLNNEREVIQAYLLSYIQLTGSYKQTLFFEALGLNDSETSLAKSVFANKKKFYSVLLGNEEDKVSVEWFQAIIQKTFKELDKLKKDIESNKTIPIELEGGFGDSIREATYKNFGFDLKPGNYPHEKETKFAIRPGKGMQPFRTMREEMWIKYSANKAKQERRRDYLITALKVVAAVGLIIISGGIGSGVAAAFFAEGTIAFVVTEVIVGAVAYTILQEGFDQLTGQGALDSDKDYIGMKDFGAAFLHNLIFFGIFRGLGAALKGYGHATRIAGTTSAFLAVEFISYIVTHGGQLPKGHDLNLLLFRTFLTVALLEAGGVLARPYTRAMIRTGKGYRFNKVLDKIETLHTETKLAQEQLSEVLAKPKRTGKEQFELLDKQLDLLQRRARVLREIQTDTEVSVEGRKDVDLAAEVTRISDVIKLMKEARFQAEVGMQQIELAGGIYSYRRGPSDLSGKDAAKAFEDYYGSGNVTGPDVNGIIRVKAGSAEMVFMPENVGLASSAIGQELATPAYADAARGVGEGLVIFEPSQINRFENLFTNKGGSWTEIDPNTFIGELAGKRTVFLSELTFNMAETALKAEVSAKGAGMQVLKSNLRSNKALKGLDAWERHEMKGVQDVEKLQKLKEMEETGRAGRSARSKESLQRILEKKWDQYQLIEEAGAVWKQLSAAGFHRLPEVRKAMRMPDSKKADALGIIQAEAVEFLAAQQVAVKGEKQFTSVEPAKLVPGVNSIAAYEAANTGTGAIKSGKLREFTDTKTGAVTVWESLGEVDILQTTPANKPITGYEVKSGKGGSHTDAITQLRDKAFAGLQIVHGDGVHGNTTYRVFERGAKATYEKDLTGVLDLSAAATIVPKSVGIKFTAGVGGFDVTVKMTAEPETSSGFGKKNRTVLEKVSEQVMDNKTELLAD